MSKMSWLRNSISGWLLARILYPSTQCGERFLVILIFFCLHVFVPFEHTRAIPTNDYTIPYSAKFSRRTIFTDRVNWSVSLKQFSRINEILLGTPFTYAFSRLQTNPRKTWKLCASKIWRYTVLCNKLCVMTACVQAIKYICFGVLWKRSKLSQESSILQCPRSRGSSGRASRQLLREERSWNKPALTEIRVRQLFHRVLRKVSPPRVQLDQTNGISLSLEKNQDVLAFSSARVQAM